MSKETITKNHLIGGKYYNFFKFCKHAVVDL